MANPNKKYNLLNKSINRNFDKYKKIYNIIYFLEYLYRV